MHLFAGNNKNLEQIPSQNQDVTQKDLTNLFNVESSIDIEKGNRNSIAGVEELEESLV